MIKLGKWITKHRVIILIVAVVLLIPSVLGMIATRINYDMLNYLPDTMETIQGQDILLNDFGKGAFSMIIVEDMEPKDVSALKEKIEAVDHVDSVIWYDSIADISIPMDILPDKIKDAFNTDHSTVMAVFFDTSTSADETMEAINTIRDVTNNQCFVSGMSAMVTDLKNLCEQEEPIYVAIAVVLAVVVMMLFMDSFLIPIIFLVSIGMAILYNLGSNYFLGEISYITKALSAILQLGVTMDYSIFLWHSYNEQKVRFDGDKERAMAHAISNSIISVASSSITTIAGFLSMCFMSFTLGADLGIVMAKGVVFGVLTVTIVLPALVLQCDKIIHKYRHRSFIPKFDKLNNFVINHKKVWVAIFVVLFIPSYIMQSNVNVYYSMDRMLPDDIGCIAALNKMKDEFNMATSHFIIVDDSLDASDLVKMENEIKDTAGVTNMVAYNNFVGSGIPDSMIPDELKSIAKSGGRQMILVNTSYVAATDECNEQLTKIHNIVKKYDKNGYVTGEGAMYKDLIDITDHDFKLTSVLSILSIFILIAIIFKSISIPTILVMSIELAIFVNKAISFATGTTLSFIAPTIIGCVQLGATVDYAILLTTRFREEMRNGHNKLDAIKIAANASDRSIFQSALVFFGATFGVFLTCDIKIVKEVCLLLARGSLISAGVIVFMLTPLLLVLEGVIEKTTYDFLGKKFKLKMKKKENKTADNNA